eukprot:UN28623
MRSPLLSRWGGLGNHRYQVGFSGDVSFNTENGWEALAFQPYFTATASNVLFGYWSHDIIAPGNTAEMETRWLQWGALSPINRLHDRGMGTGSCADSALTCHDYDTASPGTPKSDDECKAIDGFNFIPNGCGTDNHCWCCRVEASTCSPIDVTYHAQNNLEIETAALRLRAELLPYIYNHAKVAHDTGVSLLRPLYYEHPTTDDAYKWLNEYYFGEDILVAPVVNGSSITGMTDFPVWLPEGRWYDMTSGNVTDGNLVLSREYDLSEIPIFVTAGAIIPKLWVQGDMFTPSNWPRKSNWLGLANSEYESLNFE